MLMPAILAIVTSAGHPAPRSDAAYRPPASRNRSLRSLSLPLLVTRVLADHEHRAVAANDLALLAHRLDRWSYLHDPFRLGWVQSMRLWLPLRLPLPYRGQRIASPEARAPTRDPTKG